MAPVETISVYSRVRFVIQRKKLRQWRSVIFIIGATLNGIFCARMLELTAVRSHSC